MGVTFDGQGVTFLYMSFISVERDVPFLLLIEHIHGKGKINSIDVIDLMN